jgi:sodium transport system ATP-binding protein
MTEVHALCDHIVVMGRGRVVAEGSPDELMRRTGKSDLEDVFVSINAEARPETTQMRETADA